MERQNFGPGEVISIVHGGKPRDIKVDSIFKPFAPPRELVEKYNQIKASDPQNAAKIFNDTYTQQLKDFFEDVKNEADSQGVLIQDLLPFNDGDTLCSWERSAYTHYRKTLAPFLTEMGYQVVSN